MTDHLYLPDARITLCGVPLSTVTHTPLPTRLAHVAGVAPDEPCRECYRAGGVAVVVPLCANDRWPHALGPTPHGVYCSSGCMAMGGPSHTQRPVWPRDAQAGGVAVVEQLSLLGEG